LKEVKEESEESNSEIESESSENEYEDENNPFSGNKKRQRTPTPTLKKRKVSVEEEETNEVTDNSLFTMLSGKGVAIKNTVHDWLDQYLSDGELSFVSLANMLLQSAGCSKFLKEEEYKKLSDDAEDKFRDLFVDHMKNIEESYDENTFSASKISDKKFKKSFTSFWSLLVKDSGEEVIYETELIDELSEMLIVMSGTWLDPIRLIATTAGLILIDELCKVGRKLQEDVKRNVTLKIERVEGYIGKLYDAIFVNRYKDTDHLIRVECISKLPSWIDNYPMIFMDNTCLRYFGWMMSDKHWEVRLNSLKGLYMLCLKEDRLAGCRMLIERFKEALIDISTLDQHESVRTAGLDLIQLVVPLGVFSLADVELFKKCLLFDDGNEKFKHRVLTITVLSLLEHHGEEIFAVLKAIGKRHFRALVTILRDIPKASFLLDYEKLLNLVVTEEDIPEEDEKVLLNFLSNLFLSHAEDNQNEKKTTRLLITALPKLLVKYTAEIELLKPSLDILNAIDVTTYLELRMTKAYEKMWTDLTDLFFKYEDEELLGKILKLIKHHLTHEDLSASVSIKQEELFTRIQTETSPFRLAAFCKTYYVEGLERNKTFQESMQQLTVSSNGFHLKPVIYSCLSFWKIGKELEGNSSGSDSIFEIYNLQQDALQFADEFIESKKGSLSEKVAVASAIEDLHVMFSKSIPEKYSSLIINSLDPKRLEFLQRVCSEINQELSKNQEIEGEFHNSYNSDWSEIEFTLGLAVKICQCFVKLCKLGYIELVKLSDAFCFFNFASREYLDDFLKSWIDDLPITNEKDILSMVEETIIKVRISYVIEPVT
jgi:hypothetical protein